MPRSLFAGCFERMEKYRRVVARLRKKYTLARAMKTVLRSLGKRRTLDLIRTLEPLDCRNSPGVIISLTSYGKRLADCAPYAIATLLAQSVRPNRIILWVAEGDRALVPKVMKKLTTKGLEIRYCEDLRSYKKLVPAIENYPDDCIVTADDDVFYPVNWLEELLSLHRRHPKKIICHRVHGITVGEDHEILPYDKWDECVEPAEYLARHSPYALFPTGVAGILYPPRCLAKGAADKDLFSQLAPMADDIWFWAMAVTNTEYFGGESPYIAVENSCTRDLWYVNAFQQLSGGALWDYNRSQGGNDRQMKAVIERFPRIRGVLEKIKMPDAAQMP